MKRFLLALAALGLLAGAIARAAVEPPLTAATPCSNTITLGGTAQQIIPAGVKHGYQIQNLSTDPLAFSEFTVTPATLTNGSWTLNAGTATTAGGSYITPPSYTTGGAVSIIGATTGDKFTCAYW